MAHLLCGEHAMTYLGFSRAAECHDLPDHPPLT